MKEFKGRVLNGGYFKGEAVVSHQGVNTLASFQSSAIMHSSKLVIADQNNPDIFHYFTTEELYGLWYCSSVGIYNNYAFSVENQSGRTLTAQLTINDIINKADDAVAGNNRCADLRFGHDTGIGPLLSLMGVEDTTRSSPSPRTTWNTGLHSNISTWVPTFR